MKVRVNLMNDRRTYIPPNSPLVETRIYGLNFKKVFTSKYSPQYQFSKFDWSVFNRMLFPLHKNTSRYK